jgi:ribonuclease III
MINFSNFENKIGVVFRDKKLLEQAFIHRSYINESSGSKLSHNERLEFLGDAVLELVVTDYLYREYNKEDEGTLTAYRSALVNAQTIGDVASELGMNEYLLLSKGEARDSGRGRSYILANTYESFVGAVYLDSGYESARKFIENTLFPKLKDIISRKLWRDAKSLVQEKSQEYLSITPEYKVMSESGPDHDKCFNVGIYFGRDMIAEGKGHSKQEAEQEAARKALEAKDWSD